MPDKGFDSRKGLTDDDGVKKISGVDETDEIDTSDFDPSATDEVKEVKTDEFYSVGKEISDIEEAAKKKKIVRRYNKKDTRDKNKG